MKRVTRIYRLGLILIAATLIACAGMEPKISTPGVSLRNVQVQELDFSRQVFLMGFDVTNPNAFPLPIRTISYTVRLDGQHFAGGSTESAFTVAAQSDGEFAISVELDLLRTAPQLLYTVYDGVSRDIPYELKGQLGIDIPFVKPLTYESRGEIRLYASKF